MPELPEVETTVRALRRPLVGETFKIAHLYWPRHVETPGPEEFRNRLPGQRIEAIRRRGKYLVFMLSGDDTLIIHLRMTGHLSVAEKGAPLTDHTHTILELLGKKEVRFRDMRKFGRLYLVSNPAQVLGKLGPEPLAPSFSPHVLAERLKGRSMRLKSLLLDQSFVAGIGNIYADEALHYAGLHPLRGADTLQDKEIVALYHAIQRVLRMGIEREGASIDRYRNPDGSRGQMQHAVAVFRRTAEPCYRCGTPIKRIVVGGRSTHFCPTCQKPEGG